MLEEKHRRLSQEQMDSDPLVQKVHTALQVVNLMFLCVLYNCSCISTVCCVSVDVVYVVCSPGFKIGEYD